MARRTGELEVLWLKLLAMLEEASWTIVRTSLSPLVRDSFDFGCLIYDPEGRLVAQNTTVSSDLGVYHTLLDSLKEYYPFSSMRPGDVFISNDPWLTEGHLYDVSVVMPIFRNGQIVAFVECIAHLADIGGSLSNTVVDVFGEGLQIPICRFMSGGEESGEIVRFIEKNVRVPEMVMADLRALTSCLFVVRDKCTKVVEDHGLEDFDEVFSEIRERSERALRAGIRENLRSGTFVGEVRADGNTENGLRIRVKATVNDDSVELDFTGSSEQAKIGINSCFNYSFGWALFAVRTLTDTSIPNNAGCFVPVRMFAPPGTVVNPTRPAPVRNRASIAHFVPQAIYSALSEAAKKGRIIAESGSPLWVHRIAGHGARREPVAGTITYNAGMGARSVADGPSVTSFPSNTANTPIEVLENEFPIRFAHRGLLDGSGGAGTYRGGRGQRIAFEVMPKAALPLLYMHERTKFPAQGVLGGSSGRPGSARINGALLPGHGELELREGDRLELETAGGGGLGPPK